MKIMIIKKKNSKKIKLNRLLVEAELMVQMSFGVEFTLHAVPLVVHLFE